MSSPLPQITKPTVTDVPAPLQELQWKVEKEKISARGEKYRRYAMFGGVIAGGLLFVFLVYSLFFARGGAIVIAGNNLNQKGLVLVKMTGLVQYRQLTDRVQLAQEGMRFQEGSEIITGDNGYAVLSLYDGGEMRLASGSDVIVQSLEADSSGNNLQSVTFSQISGEVYHRIKPHTNTDIEYRVLLPSSIVIARGTAFDTKVDDGAGLDKVMTLQHGVQVQLFDQTLDMTEGQMMTISHSGKNYLQSDLHKDDLGLQWITQNSDRDSQLGFDMGILGDQSGPVITIDTPKDGEKSTADKTSVSGSVVGSGVSLVSINGQKVELGNDGKFTLDVALKDGDNLVVVTADDKLGNHNQKQVSISYSPATQTPATATPTTTTPANNSSTTSTPVAAQPYVLLQKISASGQTLNLKWQVIGYDAASGFKLVYGQDQASVNDGSSISAATYGKAVSTAQLILPTLGTWYFKLCLTQGADCLASSNVLVVSLTPPTPPPASTGAITKFQAVNLGKGKVNVSWNDSISGGAYIVTFSKIKAKPTACDLTDVQNESVSATGKTLDATLSSGTWFFGVINKTDLLQDVTCSAAVFTQLEVIP